MKLHRFYVEKVHDKAGRLELDRQVWIHDAGLLNQWLKVLRFKVGDQLSLFNDDTERLYTITNIESSQSVLLTMVTELQRQIPQKHIYLLWSLLKSDKNEWIVQKATELGVKDLVPIIAKRSAKTGLNLERCQKIIIEAAEQCGRADIPKIREPLGLEAALSEYNHLPLFICEQSPQANNLSAVADELGILIGPEGGWDESEKALFKAKNLPHLNLSDLTLRAETAAIAAVTIVLAK
jgi:16S rRNA (uracil1498-N3)-methyltransferase